MGAIPKLAVALPVYKGEEPMVALPLTLSQWKSGPSRRLLPSLAVHGSNPKTRSCLAGLQAKGKSLWWPYHLRYQWDGWTVCPIFAHLLKLLPTGWTVCPIFACLLKLLPTLPTASQPMCTNCPTRSKSWPILCHLTEPIPHHPHSTPMCTTLHRSTQTHQCCDCTKNLPDSMTYSLTTTSWEYRVH